ncbi:hypothetical protein BX666DRAFT_2010951 [Dichotomocladium elegans]|nr:hypothetical protein BX666DRAFT_2010951 [Dichotomocladium elegans]
MNLAERAKLNLTVLKRHDPDIFAICDQSAHAVVYKFTDKDSWVKMSIEGVLFFVHRRTSPEYALIILNRNNVENFFLYLNEITDISLHDDFLIFSTKEGKTLSLWLFEKKDRKRFLSRIKQLRKKTSDPGGDIVERFNEAFNTYQSLNDNGTVEQPDKPPPREVETNLLKLLSGNTTEKSPHEMEANLLKLLLGNNTHNGPSSANHHDLPPAATHYGAFPTPPVPSPSLTTSASTYPYHPHPPPPPPPPPPSMTQMENANTNIHSNPALIQQPPSTAIEREFPKPCFPAPRPASPNKTLTLLQVLQGVTQPQGTSTSAPCGSPQTMGQHPWPPPPATFASPLNAAPALVPQQVLELTHPELDRRLRAEDRPVLSKPEFIRQFLGMIQNDPSFLDTLYNQYYNRSIIAGERRGEAVATPGSAPASTSATGPAPLAPGKNTAPYYHQ